MKHVKNLRQAAIDAATAASKALREVAAENDKAGWDNYCALQIQSKTLQKEWLRTPLLAKLRAHNGITQREMAKAMRMSQSQYSRLEKSNTPHNLTFYQMTTALRMAGHDDVAELISHMIYTYLVERCEEV